MMYDVNRLETNNAPNIWIIFQISIESRINVSLILVVAGRPQINANKIVTHLPGV